MIAKEWLQAITLLIGLCGAVQGLQFKEFCDGPTPYLAINGANKYKAATGIENAQCTVNYNINVKKYDDGKGAFLKKICEEVAPYNVKKASFSNGLLCTYEEENYCGKVGNDYLTPVHDKCIYYKSVDLRNASAKVRRCRRGFYPVVDTSILHSVVKTIDIKENVAVYFDGKDPEMKIWYTKDVNDVCGKGWTKHIENNFVECIRVFYKNQHQYSDFWSNRMRCLEHYGEMGVAKTVAKHEVLANLVLQTLTDNKLNQGSIYIGGVNGNRLAPDDKKRWEWLDHSNITLPDDKWALGANHNNPDRDAHCLVISVYDSKVRGLEAIACENTNYNDYRQQFGFICQRPANRMLIRKIIHLDNNNADETKFGQIADRATKHVRLALICEQNGFISSSESFEDKKRYCTNLKALGFVVATHKGVCLVLSNWYSGSEQLHEQAMHEQCNIVDNISGGVASYTKGIKKVAEAWEKKHGKAEKQRIIVPASCCPGVRTAKFVATMNCTDKKSHLPTDVHLAYTLYAWNNMAQRPAQSRILKTSWDKSSIGDYPLNSCVDGYYSYRSGVIYNTETKALRDVPRYFRGPVICQISPSAPSPDEWPPFVSMREDGSLAKLQAYAYTGLTWDQAKQNCESMNKTLSSMTAVSDSRTFGLRKSYTDRCYYTDGWNNIHEYDCEKYYIDYPSGGIWVGAQRKKGEKHFRWIKDNSVMNLNFLKQIIDDIASVDECIFYIRTDQQYVAPCSTNRVDIPTTIFFNGYQVVIASYSCETDVIGKKVEDKPDYDDDYYDYY